MTAAALTATIAAACPVCLTGSEPWRTKHSQHGEFAIFSCPGCGFAFVHPRPTLAFLMDFYSRSGHSHTALDTPIASAADAIESEARFPNSTRDARRIVATIASLLGTPRAGRELLDVGCGYGFYAREAMRAGFRVDAIELASTERGIARDLAGVEAMPIPFEDYDAVPGSYAAVLMSQILEHALDINLWMAKAFRLIEPGGVLAVAVPNFDSAFRRLLDENEPFITPPSHLNFFAVHSLRHLMRKHGFVPRRAQWVSRIAPTAFAKRLPASARPLAPILAGAANTACAALDLLGLGQLVTVYGVKPLAALPFNEGSSR